jgi:hypothetical protein
MKTKTILLILTLIFIFSDCNKQDTFSINGYYSGSFSSQVQSTFTAIVDGLNYSEVPSGGVYNQKFPCLTEGTYKITDNSISLNAMVLPVVPYCQSGEQTDVKFDCLLNGDYTLVQSGEKIVFKE